MEYSSFFFGLTVLLVLLAFSTWWLSRLRRSTWHSRAIKAALVLMSLLVPLSVAEGYFLFFVDTTDSALSTLTSRRWLERHAPRSGGFRGRLLRSAESIFGPGLSVAVVGDSLTFGQGITRDQDLYSSILERELRVRGVAADVLNSSRPGWNIPEELAALRKDFEVGHVFDVVVLGFCLNDIGEYVDAEPGFNETMERFRVPPALLAPLIGRSFVASYLYFRYTGFTAPAVKKTWDKVAAAYHSHNTFQRLVADLEEFKELVVSRGARLIVLTFPETATPWAQYPHRDLHRKLGEHWRRAGVAHIDLLPVFEGHPPETLHASFMDGHPNERAHRLVATELTEALAKMLGLPGGDAGKPPTN